ncbi:hypothetical protein BH24CHL2_BH24CHL2_4990 [soil metagenome]
MERRRSIEPHPLPVGKMPARSNARTGANLPEIRYYEGLQPGDFMAVLNTIEHHRQWAIVHDHTGSGNFFAPLRPTCQCFVDGQLMETFDTEREAVDYMHRCLDAGRRL